MSLAEKLYVKIQRITRVRYTNDEFADTPNTNPRKAPIKVSRFCKYKYLSMINETVKPAMVVDLVSNMLPVVYRKYQNVDPKAVTTPSQQWFAFTKRISPDIKRLPMYDSLMFLDCKVLTWLNDKLNHNEGIYYCIEEQIVRGRRV
jgi:hypothetical protein